MVLERKIDNDGNLFSKRLICIEQPPPKLLQKLKFCCPTNYALETSKVNPVTKTLEIETINFTFDSIVEAKEQCTYKVSKTDPTKTEYDWKLTISDKSGIPYLGNKIEKTLLNRADQNAGKGLSIMQKLSEVQHNSRIFSDLAKFSKSPSS